MMLAPDEKKLLHAFVSGRVQDQQTVDFDAEVTAAKRHLGFADMIEGKDVSVALRAAGFNRVYGRIVPGQRISYERRA